MASPEKLVQRLLPSFWMLMGSVSVILLGVEFYGVYNWRTQHGLFGPDAKDSPLAGLVTSFLAVVATVVAGLGFYVAERTDRRAQNHRVLDLFLKFENNRYRQIRRRAWAARSKWYRLPEKDCQEWRANLIGGLVPSTLEQSVPQVKNPSTSDQDLEDEERWSVFTMLNLYEALAEFECDSEKLEQLGLSYPYWRGFLLDVISEYEAAHVKLTEPEKKMFPRERWSEALKDLDQRLHLPMYDKKDDPCFKGLVV